MNWRQQCMATPHAIIYRHSAVSDDFPHEGRAHEYKLRRNKRTNDSEEMQANYEEMQTYIMRETN